MQENVPKWCAAHKIGVYFANGDQTKNDDDLLSKESVAKKRKKINKKLMVKVRQEVEQADMA